MQWEKSGLSHTLIHFLMLLIMESKLSVEKHNSQLIYSLPHAESCVYSPGDI